ncbi:hypothetical protein E2C01_064870 [Portunus trituberculatus]|uniref:Uncharacterized protein n=1 Tax=Portunus trituberculatus TaxID=210409 RepID=A0A5B7HL08_PORTR|nr:hypothetical protein [Portunus trituberculatus]
MRTVVDMEVMVDTVTSGSDGGARACRRHHHHHRQPAYNPSWLNYVGLFFVLLETSLCSPRHPLFLGLLLLVAPILWSLPALRHSRSLINLNNPLVPCLQHLPRRQPAASCSPAHSHAHGSSGLKKKEKSQENDYFISEFSPPATASILTSQRLSSPGHETRPGRHTQQSPSSAQKNEKFDPRKLLHPQNHTAICNLKMGSSD